jgi:hypothetical protein
MERYLVSAKSNMEILINSLQWQAVKINNHLIKINTLQWLLKIMLIKMVAPLQVMWLHQAQLLEAKQLMEPKHLMQAKWLLEANRLMQANKV